MLRRGNDANFGTQDYRKQTAERTFKTASTRMSIPCSWAILQAWRYSSRVPHRVSTAFFCLNSPRSHYNNTRDIINTGIPSKSRIHQIISIVSTSFLLIKLDVLKKCYMARGITGTAALLGGGNHTCVKPSSANRGTSISKCFHQLIPSSKWSQVKNCIYTAINIVI